MSTSKHFDRICALAVILALLISVLFLHGEALGIQVQSAVVGYEERLFDTSTVHTIDIVIDDWDAFLSTAQSEEYSLCDVVIDGELVSSVGIRGKGNTSLSTVSSMDSDRYSFKIEFDQYDSAKSYHGLDKLSLNNLIQDNTMMKDYLTYRMMSEFGVAAPLCSYAYITVNGEDWGLYLAVEAVEDSFLQRNYGSDYGELYKPDNMNMGGGRGNGMDFSLEDFMGSGGENTESGFQMPETPGGFDPGQTGTMMPGTEDTRGEMPTMPEGFTPGQTGSETTDTPEQPTMPEGFDPSQMGGRMPGQTGEQGSFAPGQAGGGMGMGSEDTKLQYIDDDPDSYSSIFDSAKTDLTEADQTRLIQSLKVLSEGIDLESVLDMDRLMRYFVVHNFVVNGDSYTGSMIHNYYLYEEDGRLSMIPWDYNLAFGTFQGSSAANAVNDDIDAPLSVTGSGDRPIIDWIFAREEYTEQYHEYFAEFLKTVDISAIIEQAYALTAPYVEKDPTKFCTYEEFESGVDALTTFCDLRTQSVAAQLNGAEANIDASALTLSDMGTMNKGGNMGTGGRGGGISQMPGSQGGMQIPGQTGTEESTSATGGSIPTDGAQPAGESRQFPGMSGQGAPPEGMDIPEGMENAMSGDAQGRFPASGNSTEPAVGGNSRLLTGISILILLAGLLFAFRFRR